MVPTERPRAPLPYALILAVAASCGDGAASDAAVGGAAAAAVRAAPAFVEDETSVEGLERLSADPRDAESRALLAAALVRRASLSGSDDDYRRAEVAAREALVRDPLHELALASLAAALTGLQREADAAALCRESLAKRPGSDAVLAALFDALFESGRIDEAAAIGDRMIGRAPSSTALFACARVAEARGRLDDALRSARLAAETAAAESAPASEVAAAWALAARVHLDLGAGGEAMQAALRATSVCDRSGAAWRTLAAVHAALGRQADALAAAERAAAITADARTLRILAAARRGAGDADGAAASMRSARDAAERNVERRPEDLAALLDGTRDDGGGDDARAIELATRAALARPRPDNRLLRARLLHRSGRFADACSEILELMHTGHRSAPFLLAAARILHDGQHRREAEAALSDLLSRGALHHSVEAQALELEFADLRARDGR